ncbi:transposable element Tc1 transposase [Trichonephila clavipes]|nr:transposable element Tc1 transposase [Trichonephila clavipes]
MHCSSTDKKPMHGKCPEGESSWCFYKRAIAKGETPGSHSFMRTYLSPQVVEKIMPVYQRLASDTILERCVAGKTQIRMKVCIAAFGENAQKRNCWEQWTREGTHARKTGSGATRKTKRREDRRIVRQALADPTVTRSTIRADVGVAIVPQTISRHLAEANLKSKRPFCALPLTPEHQQLRLQWCPARSMWNVTDWQKAVFSD